MIVLMLPIPAMARNEGRTPLILTPDPSVFASGVSRLARVRTSQIPRRRAVGRRILGGALGAVGGYFAGGYIGAKIDGQCDCDDPGVKGAVIGAPIGAVVGGIIRGKWF